MSTVKLELTGKEKHGCEYGWVLREFICRKTERKNKEIAYIMDSLKFLIFYVKESQYVFSFLSGLFKYNYF